MSKFLIDSVYQDEGSRQNGKQNFRRKQGKPRKASLTIELQVAEQEPHLPHVIPTILGVVQFPHFRKWVLRESHKGVDEETEDDEEHPFLDEFIKEIPPDSFESFDVRDPIGQFEAQDKDDDIEGDLRVADEDPPEGVEDGGGSVILVFCNGLAVGKFGGDGKTDD